LKDYVLEIKNLKTYFNTSDGVVKAVDDVSLRVKRGKTLGLVGESGCGKSVTAMSILRLIPSPPGRIAGGEVIFDGDNILNFSERDMRGIRGNRISMIFQEPMTSLNPVFTVGNQIAEAITVHNKVSKKEAVARSVEMLRLVGIPSSEERIKAYPHQMSGGMRQRVMIAMALSCSPDVLIADEPTTALDVTIQAQILDLISQLQSEMRMATILITHSLGIVAETAEDMAVMYAGKVVESGSVKDIFSKQLHPYTRGLLNSLPRLDKSGQKRLATIPGTVPDLKNLPKGCAFYPRCEFRVDACTERLPELAPVGKEHFSRCIRAREI